MKNFTFTFFTFLFMSLSLQAQFVQTARIASDARITASGDNNRGAAFNAATNTYLVANRATPAIHTYTYTPSSGALAFNSSGGSGSGSLNMTGVTGGTVSLIDVEVADDGVIYASNLTTNPTTSAFKIYRWANESATPTVAFNATIGSLATTERLGDAFDVQGSGTSTVILVSGNHSSSMVYKFVTADGSNFTYDSKITVIANSAAHGIAQITAGGEFYGSRSASGTAIGRYPATGASSPTTTLTTSFVSDVHGDIDYLEAGGKKWLAISGEGAAAGGGVKLVDVTDGDAQAKIYGKTPNLGAVTNSNASSDVEIIYDAVANTITILTLVDNNGIAAYRTTFGETGTTVRWTGSGGDGKWATATNWSSGAVPRAVDDVILDNTTVSGSYTVTLTGTETVCAKSLQIGYVGNTNTITLSITNGSLANELYFGDQTNGNDDLIIEEGGVLENISAATAGDVFKRRYATSTTTGDRFVIRAKGTYKHNTARSASNAWFDAGPNSHSASSNFEYHVGSNAAIPLSGRTYGNLKLVPATAKTFTASGANSTTVNDFVLNSNATLTDAGTGTMNISGNVTVDGTLTYSGTRSLNFNGTTAQTYSDASPASVVTVTGGLTINNTAGLTLNAPLQYNGALTLTNGLITTTSTNILRAGTAATASTGSATSYINGPMAKIGGATAFHFPVGKNGKVQIIGIANTAATSTFTAEYFATRHASYNNVDAPLIKISEAGYWDLSRTSGSDAADVIITWDNNSGVVDYTKMVVAHNTGANWFREATSGTPTGDNSAGTVTATGVSTFSPFALGSSDALALPLELLTIKAIEQDQKAVIMWTTASETNLDIFEVQRSKDGKTFAQVGTVKAEGKAANYSFIDAQPINGINYYRLKSIDIDKTFEYSQIVSLQNNKTKANIKVYPTATTGMLTVESNGSQVEDVTIFNYVGQVVLTAKYTNNLNISHLPSGMYLLQVRAGQENVIEKILKQ